MRLWSTPPGASRATAHVRGMLRVAALLCFFGFCRSGEITVPSASAYDERVHLAWGDVAVVKGSSSIVRIHLKRSKCDQLGRGVDIFVGRMHSELCPVSRLFSTWVFAARLPAPSSYLPIGPRLPNSSLWRGCARRSHPWACNPAITRVTASVSGRRRRQRRPAWRTPLSNPWGDGAATRSSATSACWESNWLSTLAGLQLEGLISVHSHDSVVPPC